MMSHNDSNILVTLQNLETGHEANTTVDDNDQQIISDEFKLTFRLYHDIIFRGTVSFFGTAGNVFNMIIFYRLGIKDSMSVGLMALSFTDFVVTLLGLVGPVSFLFGHLFPYSVFDPVTFQYLATGWYRDVGYLISGWITTLLSVERCVCVVSPFRVRQIFTRTRAIIAVVMIYVILYAFHMPLIISQWMIFKDVEMEGNNGTTLMVRKMGVAVSDNRDELFFYIDVVNGSLIPIPSQVIVIISVIWMIYGLHASSQVRKSAAEEENDNSKKPKSKLSSRESKLVKVVLFLAIILTACNAPRFFAVYMKRIFKQIQFGKKKQNLYTIVWNISNLIVIINSSVNIFVYLKVNLSYRQEFKKMVGLAEKSK